MKRLENLLNKTFGRVSSYAAPHTAVQVESILTKSSDVMFINGTVQKALEKVLRAEKSPEELIAAGKVIGKFSFETLQPHYKLHAIHLAVASANLTILANAERQAVFKPVLEDLISKKKLGWEAWGNNNGWDYQHKHTAPRI